MGGVDYNSIDSLVQDCYAELREQIEDGFIATGDEIIDFASQCVYDAIQVMTTYGILTLDYDETVKPEMEFNWDGYEKGSVMSVAMSQVYIEADNALTVHFGELFEMVGEEY